MPALRIATVQMRMTPSPEVNIDRARQGVEDAAKQGARWVLLPELVHLLYPGQTRSEAIFDSALPAQSPLFSPLQSLAAEKEIYIALPFFEKRLPGVYANSLLLLGPDGPDPALYRKTHIPEDPGFGEKYYFTPGEQDYFTWDAGGLQIAPLICWDQWYPEAARICALRGAQLLLYPTAIGWLPEEEEDARKAMADAWRTIQRSHAIANGLYVATANRTGWEAAPDDTQQGIQFWGQSFIVDPTGLVLAEAGADEETVLIADLSIHQIEKTRRTWPFFRDRRIDLYGPILKRHG